MSVREQLEQRERQFLSPFAARSAESRGRARPEPPDPLRPAFEHDRDRLVHCKAFRRLAGKTQVFLAPEGDHYRTRITHTLEVSQIARTIARALALNEHLAEAITMGHDLGHTPFGHAGESVLARLMPDGFHHVRQSLRVVDILERDGQGLNLTEEVRDGILKHTKGKGSILSDSPNLTATTLEGQAVRLADIVAYVNHDLDDAMRAGLVRAEEVPRDVVDVLGPSHSDRIARMVTDVLTSTHPEERRIRMSSDCHEALYKLRDFLYSRVYEIPAVKREFQKAQRILEDLWGYFLSHQDQFRERYWPKGVPQTDSITRAVGDFVAGMTDRYALRLYDELFLPRPWMVL